MNCDGYFKMTFGQVGSQKVVTRSPEQQMLSETCAAPQDGEVIMGCHSCAWMKTAWVTRGSIWSTAHSVSVEEVVALLAAECLVLV